MPSISDYKSILITGATSGLGRALAVELSKLPSKPQVIATGRRQQRLKELEEKGIVGEVLDIGVPREALKQSVEGLLVKYPEIDSFVLNAGIQREFDFTRPETIHLDGFEEELNTNYLSVVATVKFILPHLMKLSEQGRPCSIIIVTSGLCLLPAAFLPGYCGSKAALHSFTMSLRAQLRSVAPNIQVVEIIPPLVESELHDAEGTTETLSAQWMTLDEWSKITMDGLLKGEETVTAGMSTTMFQRFEKDKQEIVDKLAAVQVRSVKGLSS